MFGGVACLFFLCSSCCYLVKSLTNLKYYPRRQCNDSRQMAIDIRDQTQQTNFIQTPCSLRADEIKLWLTNQSLVIVCTQAKRHDDQPACS